MIIIQHPETKFRRACQADIKRNNMLCDHAGESYKILEVVRDLVSSYMLVQHLDKKITKHIPCDAIDQFLIRE